MPLFGLLPDARRNRVVLATARLACARGQPARHPRRDPPPAAGRRVVLLLEPYGYGLAAKIGYLLRLVRGMYHVRTAGLVVVDNAWLPVHVAPHRAGPPWCRCGMRPARSSGSAMDTLTPPDEPERTFLHRYYDYVV